jgi:subtilase-type serine protease
MNRFYRGRIAGLDLENGLGGGVAVLGNPMQSASRLSVNFNQPGEPVMAYAEEGEMTDALPETMSAFFAGGYLDGDSSAMATAVPFGGDDNFDGYYIAAGIESELAENAAIGFGLSYTDIDGTTGGAPQGASGKLYQGTLYGKLQSASGITLDTQLSAAMFSARTQRTATLGATSYDLRSKDDTLALSAEVGVSKLFDAGALEIGPRAALRVSRIAFTPTVERGGPMALAFDRGNYDSLQGLLGFTLGGGVGFRPYASAYFVHEFEDKPGAFAANFVGGTGLPAAFALAGYDKNWFEASAGIAFGSEKFEVSLGADTTIGRSDVSNQSYRGTVTFRF